MLIVLTLTSALLPLYGFRSQAMRAKSAIGIVTNGLGNVFTKMLEAIITLGTGIFNAILSLVFAIYCLARKEILIRQARRLIYSIFPEHVCDEIVRIMRMTNSTFTKFISGGRCCGLGGSCGSNGCGRFGDV